MSEDDLGASHEAARLDEFAERLPDDRGREGREGVHPCGGSGLGSCAGACSALFGPALRRRGLALLPATVTNFARIQSDDAFPASMSDDGSDKKEEEPKEFGKVTFAPL